MKRVMFVDGYNVIRSSGLYDHIDTADYTDAESGLNSAREALISDVATFTSGYYDVTIVFDGASNAAHSSQPWTFGGIKVVFSRSGQSADSLIEKYVHEVRDSADEVVVVTSDALIQWTVLGSNVTRMSSSNFAEEIRRMNTIDRDDANILIGSRKNTLVERLDPQTAEKLRRLRDGLEN